MGTASDNKASSFDDNGASSARISLIRMARDLCSQSVESFHLWQLMNLGVGLHRASSLVHRWRFGTPWQEILGPQYCYGSVRTGATTLPQPIGAIR